MINKRLFNAIVSSAHHFEFTPPFLSRQMPTVLRIVRFDFIRVGTLEAEYKFGIEPVIRSA